MDGMDVMSSDEEVEDINSNKENMDVVPNSAVTQTEERNTVDSGDFPNHSVSSHQSSNHDVHEEMQVKLQLGNKSNPKIASEVGVHNRGDGASVQNPPKTDASPSTSKVASRRRVRAPRIHEIILRPILPRKSKDRAKYLLKAIARGIIIPKTRTIRPRAPKPAVKRIRFGRKKQVAKKSLMTVWRRTRRDRSADSWLSDLCSCGHCDCNQSSYY